MLPFGFRVRFIERCSVALLAVVLLAGCATDAKLKVAEIRQELEARSTARVELGPQQALTSARMERLVSTIDTAGAAHLAGIDSERKLHYIVVDGAGQSRESVVATLSNLGEVDAAALDIVEYPVGTIRIAAGDMEFTRPVAGGEWSQGNGNRCRQYVLHDTSLYCAFVASGEHVGTTAHTEVTWGIVIIFPVFWWNTTRPDKLVLAELVGNTWVVRTALDPANDMSARQTDFALGVDRQGNVHTVFSARHAGSTFFMVGGGVTLGAIGAGPGVELRYGRFPLPTRAGASNARTDWQEVASEQIKGILGVRTDMGYSLNSILEPLALRVAIAPTAGVPIVLVRNSYGTLTPLDKTWDFPIAQGAWATGVVAGDGFEFLAVEDFPTLGSYRFNDTRAILKIDTSDIRHILVEACVSGFWEVSCRMIYIRRREGGQLATANLSDPGPSAWMGRTLATGQKGRVFATWQPKEKGLVGRWIEGTGEFSASADGNVTKQQAGQIAIPEYLHDFATGKAELITPGLFIGYGAAAKAAMNTKFTKWLHDDGHWEHLAKIVLRDNYGDDLRWYYLGRAAEGMSLCDAATVYYRISRERSETLLTRCLGLACSGFKLPEILDDRFNSVESMRVSGKCSGFSMMNH